MRKQLHIMKDELNKLRDYATRCLRNEYDNSDNIAAAIDCIEFAEEIGLKELYKEMLEDFLYVDENRAFWKRYMKKQRNDIEANY